MGATASHRESYIDNHPKMHELKDRVSSTDWRQQCEEHPLAFIGLALGGGAIVAALAAGYYRRHRSSSARTVDAHDFTPRKSSATFDKASAALENIKGALLGVAISRFRDYADEILPGFSEHFQKAASDRR